MQDPVVVVGLGRSGIGAARLLNARGADVWLLESNNSPEKQQRADALSTTGIQVELGKPLALESFEALPCWPSVVVVSPGIASTIRFSTNYGIALQRGRRSGARLGRHGEHPLGWDHRHQWQNHRHILGGPPAATGGPRCAGLRNIGASAAELALACLEGEQPERVVVELSSYQIEAAPSVQPSIGVWTTLTPDHLDRHGTLSATAASRRGSVAEPAAVSQCR